MLLPCLRIKVKKPPISSRAIQEETGWINILLKNVTFETEEKSYKWKQNCKCVYNALRIQQVIPKHKN